MKLKDNKAKHRQAGPEKEWELVEQTEGLDKGFEKDMIGRED